MACWDDGAPALLQRQSPDYTHAIRVLDQSGRRPSLFTSPKQSDTNAGSGDTNFGYFQPSSAPIQEDRASGRGGSKDELGLMNVETWELQRTCSCVRPFPMKARIPGESMLRCFECLKPYPGEKNDCAPLQGRARYDERASRHVVSREHGACRPCPACDFSANGGR